VATFVAAITALRFQNSLQTLKLTARSLILTRFSAWEIIKTNWRIRIYGNIKGLKRTAYCGTLHTIDVGSGVVLFGWAQRQRDLGNLIFIDLRDRTVSFQLAFDGNTDPEIFEKAKSVRSEDVLAVARLHPQERER
jgi:hypothetical protein